MPRLHSGQSVQRINLVLAIVTATFACAIVALLNNAWGRPAPRPAIPLVDPALIDPAPSYRSYADLVRANEDVSLFSCYICHEENQPPKLTFDDQHRIIIPEEHENIVMNHGDHNRNNHCFNCHNEHNRETFHIRDGRELAFSESSTLCGSCHGPTYRDWEAGAHGRISGYWDHTLGDPVRLNCVNCHDPHSPRIPSRRPAPGPNPRLLPIPPAPSIH